jgi:tRNA pseudouridine13 synthase
VGEFVRLKFQPEDFTVEELIRPSPLPVGERGGLPFAVYRVRKRGVTTLQVRERLAAMLHVPQSAIAFPGLKDKDAIAIQYASVRGGGPNRLEGAGFTAELVGRSDQPLRPADLAGNRFVVVVRGLTRQELDHRRDRLSEAVQFGVPNYFDLQRFGSYVPGEGFIGKKILQRDVEGAVRAYLSRPMAGDPPPVRTFKAFARQHWGDWPLLFEHAPRPSNFRSVLVFLKDHPADFKKALNLVTPALLPLFLAAYQSHLWNRVAGRYLQARLEAVPVEFARLRLTGKWGSLSRLPGEWGSLSRLPTDETLPVHHTLPPTLAAELLAFSVPLLQHRARFDDPALATAAEAVLTEEGLGLNDLKARVLRRAYLPKGTRRLLVVPHRASAGDEHEDEQSPGRLRLTVSFDLPPGSYATLVLKALAV